MKSGYRAAGCLLLVATAARAYEPAGTPDDWAPPMGVPMSFGKVLVDRLEAGLGDGENTVEWDMQAWYGRDFTRLWLKTEGEGELGASPGDAEVQALYSRLFAPFWDWQLGLRYDLEPAGRAHLVLGLQGVVPYELEWDSAVFVSEDGDVSARLEIEYDLLITQRLVAQPRFELNASASDVPDFGLGSGIADTELGIRLRYEIRREFAPYFGIGWKKLHGDTAAYARANGEATSQLQVKLGIRAWF
jgi:copper resistance protein B